MAEKLTAFTKDHKKIVSAIYDIDREMARDLSNTIMKKHPEIDIMMMENLECTEVDM